MALSQFPIRCDGGGNLIVAGRFYPAGTGAPTGLHSTGNLVASVARSDTGKFTLTMRESPFRLLACIPGVSIVGDATDITAQGGVESVSAGTAVIKTKAGATNTDVAADADNHVDFLLILEPSTSG